MQIHIKVEARVILYWPSKECMGRQWGSAIALGTLTTALYLILLMVAILADLIILFAI